MVGADLSPIERAPVADAVEAAIPQPESPTPAVKESGRPDSAASTSVVGVPLPDVKNAAAVSGSVPLEPTDSRVSPAAVVGTDAAVGTVDVAAVGRKISELHQLLAEGQERLSQEIAKSQSQTVRNVSGLAHDVDLSLIHI